MNVRVRQHDDALPPGLLEVKLERQGMTFLVTLYGRGDDHMIWLEEIDATWPDPRAALERSLKEWRGFSQAAALKASTLLFDRMASLTGRTDPPPATS